MKQSLYDNNENHTHMMHIVLIDPLSNFLRGGAETNNINLGRALIKSGHKVTYLVGYNNSENCYSWPEWGKVVEIPTPRFQKSTFSAAGIFGKIRRLHFYRNLAKEICSHKPECLNTADLVLVTGRPILTRIREVTQAPVVHSVRGRMGRFNEWFARKADGLIFWGGCEVDNPPRLLSRRPVLKVDPGVDESYFHPAPPLPELERSLRGDDTKALNIVFAGRIEPIKRIEHIIRAVASVVRSGRSVYLSIVGDGSIRPEIEQLAETHLPRRVTFHGRQDPSGLANILRASDVFMLTSRRENHPISIKEALACGLDVIAYGVGRVPQLLYAESNSIVVPFGDEKALAETLAQRADEGRVPTEKRVASSAITWQDVAEKLVSWSEREFVHHGEQ